MRNTLRTLTIITGALAMNYSFSAAAATATQRTALDTLSVLENVEDSQAARVGAGGICSCTNRDGNPYVIPSATKGDCDGAIRSGKNCVWIVTPPPKASTGAGVGVF